MFLLPLWVLLLAGPSAAQVQDFKQLFPDAQFYGGKNVYPIENNQLYRQPVVNQPYVQPKQEYAQAPYQSYVQPVYVEQPQQIYVQQPFDQVYPVQNQDWNYQQQVYPCEPVNSCGDYQVVNQYPAYVPQYPDYSYVDCSGNGNWNNLEPCNPCYCSYYNCDFQPACPSPSIPDPCYDFFCDMYGYCFPCPAVPTPEPTRPPISTTLQPQTTTEGVECIFPGKDAPYFIPNKKFGKNYYASGLESYLNWHVADAKAIDLQAGDTEKPSGLAKIQSKEEAEFIKSIIKCFPPGTEVWIGLNSIAYKDKWVWADGEKLKDDLTSNWEPRYPAFDGRCVYITPDSGWRNQKCIPEEIKLRAFIAEMPYSEESMTTRPPISTTPEVSSRPPLSSTPVATTKAPIQSTTEAEPSPSSRPNISSEPPTRPPILSTTASDDYIDDDNNITPA